MDRLDTKVQLQEILLKYIDLMELDANLLDELTDFIQDNFEAKHEG